MRKKKNNKQKISLKQIFKTEITNILQQSPSNVYNYKQLSSMLGARSSEHRKLVYKILNELSEEGIAKETAHGKFKYLGSSFLLQGKVDLNQRGNGYIIIEGVEEDVFVRRKNLLHAFQDDIVELKLLTQKKSKPEGIVTQIIERGIRQLVGKVQLSEKYAFVIPDNKKIPVDIFVSNSKLKGAKQNDKVIVEITDWPQDASSPFGKVLEILGSAGDNNVEMLSILAEHQLPNEFPSSVIQEADKIQFELNEEEIKRRRDFRKATTFTIDPADAKDFDDALSIEFLKNGNYQIGVHIADVSHYVTAGTKLDQEASERGNSVYLADRVIPMLPEILSNGVCSLRPQEEKLCFSVIMELNDQAEVLSSSIEKTIIYSDHRFAYEEAQEIIESNEGLYSKEILLLDRLAKIIRKQRIDQGALDIVSEEVRFKFDEEGNPIEIYKKIAKDANKLIEEFMLLANKKVAQYVGLPEPNKEILPFVYRVHDLPDQQKLNNLVQFIRKFGYKININNEQDAGKSINKLLNSIKDKPEYNIIQQMSIRSMAKAYYTTNNIGHYGLYFEHYSHFTSPIRRYADLIVHRLLELYLSGKKYSNVEKLESTCKHISLRERKAIEAERNSIKFKQVQFMMDKVGEEFNGAVTGVTEWGIYVEIKETMCEGLIHIDSFTSESIYYDAENYCLSSYDSKTQYKMGDNVRIKLINADLEKRQLDLQLLH